MTEFFVCLVDAFVYTKLPVSLVCFFLGKNTFWSFTPFRLLIIDVSVRLINYRQY